jgi:hypothetical protein
MAELAYDIEQLYIEGYSPKSIAIQLECPLEIVYGWIEEQGVDSTDDELSPFSTMNS